MEDDGGAIMQAIQKFCCAHCDTFDGSHTEEGFKVEFSQIHIEFKDMVEQFLEDFIT